VWTADSRAAAALAVAALCVTSVPASGVALASGSSREIRLSPGGIAGVALGSGETASLRQLRSLFGTPKRRDLSPARLPSSQRLCGFTGEVDWAHLNAYFYAGRLVGYAVWAQHLSTRDGHVRPAATATGLVVGDSLRQARDLYGNVRRSLAQGGSWGVAAKGGQFLGYSQGARLQSPILSIEAGHVGCGALAPQP
jgi:hypothetical protein